MKLLTLLRHAKAERESPTDNDFDRSLNQRGHRDATRMGEEIRRLGLTYDLVLASPARRVAETVDAASGLSPRIDHRIYDASTTTLFDIVRSVDDGIGRLMLVGHNPGFERLAAQLTSNEVVEVPTGALVEIELPVDRWSDVTAGSGQLVRFIKPKELG
jgi:phosphohistidine phosphatase